MSSILLPSRRIAQPHSPALVGRDYFFCIVPGVMGPAKTITPANLLIPAIPGRTGLAASNVSRNIAVRGAAYLFAPLTMVAVLNQLSMPSAGAADAAKMTDSAGSHIGVAATPYIFTWYMQQQYSGPVVSTIGSGPASPAPGMSYVLVWRSASATNHELRVRRSDGGMETVTSTTAMSGNPYTWPNLIRFGSGGFQSCSLFAAMPGVVADAVAESLLRNPWQIFAPHQRRIWFDVGAASGGAAVLEGGADGAASATGALTTGIPIAGAALGMASASGAFTTAINMQGAAASLSGAAGVMTATIRFEAQALAQALAAAAMASGIILTADAVMDAAAQGSLDTLIAFIAQAQSAATAGGTLTVGGTDLAGAAQGTAAGSAILSAQIRFAADAIANAAASAQFAGAAAQLAGIAAAASLADGILTTTIPISAAAFAQALASGSLAIDLPLAGLAQAAAAGHADLTARILLAADASSATAAGGLLASRAQLLPLSLRSHAGRAMRVKSRAERQIHLIGRASHVDH